MKWLLLLVLLISSQFIFSQANNCRYCNPADNCLQIKDSKIVNVCAITDNCLIVKKGKIINSCSIPDSCLTITQSKITSKCGNYKDSCLTVVNAKVFNSCAVEDPCLKRRGSTIINTCGVYDTCLRIIGSRIINSCSIVMADPVSTRRCTTPECCLKEVKEKVNKACNGCEVYGNETLLIYDAKTRKFYYNKPCNRNEVDPIPLTNLNRLKLPFKRPFRFEIINLNRYLYNVNLGNSDIAFTSSESAVMQQYLVAGTTNGQIQPANTYINGGSGNQGDNIFNYVPGFKTYIDKIGDLISTATPITTIANNTRIVQTNLTNYIDSISELNQYSTRLDNLWSGIDQIQKRINSPNPENKVSNKDSADFLNKVEAYTAYATRIINQIENHQDEPAYKKLMNANFIQFKTLVDNLNTSVLQKRQQAISDSSHPKTAADTLIGIRGTALKAAFDSLEKYYNHYLDNKIIAYSICTDTFKCCGLNDSINTYSHFNSLLTAISERYSAFKQAVKNGIDSPKKLAPAPQKTYLIQTDKAKFAVQNNRITGIELQEPLDTAKPKKDVPDDKTAAINALDTLWYTFEKSISPEFILKQILFNRNMVEENMKYVSPPIFPYGDRMGLVFQIVASDSAKKNGVILDHTTTESLDFMVSKKALFSFSAGTFVGLGGSLKSPTFSFQQVPALGSNTVQSTSPYKLMPTGNGSVPIGIDGLANITGRICSVFRFGFSAGVGVIVTPAVQVGYLAGLTGSIGTYQQFHFTFGRIGMNVNELKSSYSVNSNVLYAASPGSDIYNQKIKAGYFLSISYTIYSPKGSGSAQIATTTATK